MSAAPVSAEPLMTAEEFLRLPDDGTPRELVRGRVVRMKVPVPRHGQVCANIVRIIGSFAEEHNLGRVLGNRGSVVTERNPDTVRRPRAVLCSRSGAPLGPLPRGCLAPISLVVEVRFDGERWPNILFRVAEYLTAGARIVCVLDEVAESVLVWTDDEERVLRGSQTLELSDILPGFSVPVRRFFA